MKNLLLLFSLLLLLGACTFQNSPKTIYIVRHAEKQLVGDDPELAYVGGVRALKLSQILEKENIKHIFSTDYIRTKSTAKPTAEKAGLSIEIYDPKNHDALVEELRKREGNTLVVGHSNTVSKLANYFVQDAPKYSIQIPTAI